MASVDRADGTTVLEAQEDSEEQAAYLEAQQSLQRECEDLWSKVQELQEKVQASRVPVKAETRDPEAISLVVGNSKVRSLKALIQVQREFQPPGLPTQKAALKELFLCDLERTTHQLQQTATVIRSQNEDYKEKVDRERKWLEEQTDIQLALTAKLDNVAGGTPAKNLPKKSLLQQLDKETQTLVKYNDRRLKQLKAFIREHVPEPNEEDIRKWAKKRNRENTHPLSLFSIVEELLHKCQRAPHDPYIRLTPAHNAPHIEFLIRNDIAQHHPEDSNQVCLTPFHL